MSADFLRSVRRRRVVLVAVVAVAVVVGGASVALFAGGAQARTATGGGPVIGGPVWTDLVQDLLTGHPYDDRVSLGATIDPQGEDTTWHVDFGLTDQYGSTTLAFAVAATDPPADQGMMITWLLPSTTYHFKIVAENASGTASTVDYTFTTADPPPPPVDPGNPPVIDNLEGTALGDPETGLLYEDRSIVDAIIDPRGEDTSWSVEYGLTDQYGLAAAGGLLQANRGSSWKTVTLSGLAPSSTYHFRFIATNASGTTESADSTFATPGPAANIEPPTVGGNPLVGRQLEVWSGGLWSQTEWDPVYSYQWQRCDASAADCTDIEGATSNEYTVGAADLGSVLRVAVTVTNSYGVSADGTSTGFSAPTGIVSAIPPPASTGQPTISGIFAEGGSLWVDPGTWSAEDVVFSFQWERCTSTGESCDSIDGATDEAYVPIADDLGSTLRATVTAANDGGSDSATSPPSETIAPVEVPINSSPPTISGDATLGSDLSVDVGEWTPYVYSFSLEWQRCDTAGENCADIADTDSDSWSYVTSGDDLGSTLRVIVTASNLGLSTTVASAPSAAIESPDPDAVSRPVKDGPPSIEGDAIVGNTLTATTGSWRYEPTSFTYYWSRCDSAGAACYGLGGSGQQYTLTDDELGGTMRVDVVASNQGGYAMATSAATVVISGPSDAPANITLPAISGTPTAGTTLSVSAGSWTDYPTTYDYQWQRCDSEGDTCADLADTDSSTYLLTAGDVGATLRAAVTASNAVGSTSVTTSATDVIAVPVCDATGDVPSAAGGPGNDDFSSAQALFGESGSVSGTLTDATVENDSLPAESGPSLQSLDGAGWSGNPTRSVWYCWTPPTSAVYDFNTMGSPPPLSGSWGATPSASPPVVVVWTGTHWGADRSSDPAELKKTAADLAGVNSGSPHYEIYSDLNFAATAGTQYLVEVENQPDVTPDAGDFLLNWSPNLDPDRDGVLSPDDNCELLGHPKISYNPSQVDDYPTGGDGIGDACQSGVLVIHNNSSHGLTEYNSVPGESYRNLGDPTGRTCAAGETCTFDDSPAGVRTYWHADDTDASGSSADGLCADSDTGVLLDCNPPGADWEVEFHYSYAGHGDDATAEQCGDAELSGYNSCYDEYSTLPWQAGAEGADTTPPNAGLEATDTGEGVETLTATDIPIPDQTPATGAPLIPDPPAAAPQPQSPIGPAPEGSYTTEDWSADAIGIDGGLKVVTSTAPGTTALTGVVEDDATGMTVAFATVTASYYSCADCEPLTTTTQSGPDGSYAFIDLPTSDDPGASYTLMAHTEGYYGDVTVTNIVFEPDNTYEYKFELTTEAETIDASPIDPTEEASDDETLGTMGAMVSTARAKDASDTSAEDSETAENYYSQADIPPVIRVGVLKRYSHAEAAAAYKHDHHTTIHFCGPKPSSDQPSPIPVSGYSLSEYALRVVDAEVTNVTHMHYNDLAMQAFLSMVQNYAWYHKTTGGPFDLDNSTNRECLGNNVPTNVTHIQTLMPETWGVRVVDDTGLTQTSFNAGTFDLNIGDGDCNDSNPDYAEHSGTASQWTIQRRSELHGGCHTHPWEDLLLFFYPTDTRIVPGDPPGKTLPQVTPRGNGVRLSFFSIDSKGKAPHTSSEATGWNYHLEYLIKGNKQGDNTWHPLYTTGYSDKGHDVQKTYDVDPPVKCTTFYRVWASNPVGAGQMAYFNNDHCVTGPED